mgnify:CR=1 FL=1
MMPCSNMEMIIRKETNMNLHIDDGVQFGLGAFETIAVEKNNLFFLKDIYKGFSTQPMYLILEI